MLDLVLCTCKMSVAVLSAQVAGQKQQTVVMPHSRSPIYNSHHEFFNVQLPDVLTVQVGGTGAGHSVRRRRRGDWE